MPKRPSTLDLAALSLDAAAPAPLYRQLYGAVRAAVLDRRLAPGRRLPATRELSAALNISRNTVVLAFAQLIAEGYLEARVGDGTYVTRALPEAHRAARRPGGGRRPAPAPQLARRFQRLLNTLAHTHNDVGATRAFRPGEPGLDPFPARLWGRLMARRWRAASEALLGYGANLGYAPLRQAVADYLGATRGARCAPEQVIITQGSQDALNLIAQLVLNPDDAVWLEDPGYRGARAAVLMAGGQIVPVPVDAEGLQVEAGIALQPEARLAYVTPSHQYPLGGTLSLARRLALLDWAARARAWIIEDDYDSEFRYHGRPLSALQGLDEGQRVLYVGTFSKVLFPSLRLGYLVAPEALVPAFEAGLRLTQHHLPGVEQAVLTDFINEGHFARHIRQMRQLYGERREALVNELARVLSGRLTVGPAEAGLHLTALLAPGVDDRAVARAAQRLGVEAPALSTFSLRALPRGGLVLGYAGLTPGRIREGVRLLRQAVEAAGGRRGAHAKR